MSPRIEAAAWFIAVVAFLYLLASATVWVNDLGVFLHKGTKRDIGHHLARSRRPGSLSDPSASR